jgi:cyclopropane fatty-acyl-phospholipid synthase-like methyltransferase
VSDIPADGARLEALARAYDGDAARRHKGSLEWRRDLIDEWSRQLAAGIRILELGAGTGQASAHLAAAGFEMLALDLSPGNVAKCRQRGVPAVMGDMGRLEDIDDPLFDPPYDAAFAINALIHFPKAQVDGALTSIRMALAPGAPFLFTLWGGESSEGVWDTDWCDPPRFFSFYVDAEAAGLEFTHFEKVGVRTLDNSDAAGLHSVVFELRAR